MGMSKQQKSPLKKFVSRFITITCLAVFIYASYGLFDTFMDYYQNRQMLSDIQETYYNVASAEETEKNTPSNKIRSGFDELLKQNEDVAGWLTIDGTQIDYPILQADDNINYLTQNFNGDESIAGSIFLDYRNEVASKNLNTVVYGHRMKDGSMFQQLTKFFDHNFFNTHRTFEFDTLYTSYEAEIFAVYNTLTDFNYIQTEFDNDEQYEQLLLKMQEKSRFQTNIELSADDQIITLSTCDYELDENDGRLVVHAKLTEK